MDCSCWLLLSRFSCLAGVDVAEFLDGEDEHGKFYAAAIAHLFEEGFVLVDDVIVLSSPLINDVFIFIFAFGFLFHLFQNMHG